MAQRGQRIPSRMRALGCAARPNGASPSGTVQARAGCRAASGCCTSHGCLLEVEHAMKEIGVLEVLHGSLLKIACSEGFLSEFLPGALAAFKARRAGFSLWRPCALFAITCSTR